MTKNFRTSTKPEDIEKLKALIIKKATRHIEKSAAESWYKTPNLNLGGLSPQQLVEKGRATKVFQFIEAAGRGETLELTDE